MKYTELDLRQMQEWSLERKIRVTQTRIIEYYKYYNGNVAVSFSGGKDSTVLLDIARRCYPNICAVYVNTGLEFPEVRQFAVSQNNITEIKPVMNFREVINTYGWCFPSKAVAHSIYYAKQGSKWAIEQFRGVDKHGNPSRFRQSHYKKWGFLVESHFKISDKCCDIMKKQPFHQYTKKTGIRFIIGTLADESFQRKQSWFKTGCNSFNSRLEVSRPLSFWTEQDILQYIKRFKISYASIYGDIIQDKNGDLKTSGEQRTGCMFCPIGCHLETPNKFKRLATNNHVLYEYCIYKLKLNELLDYAKIAY